MKARGRVLRAAGATAAALAAIALLPVTIVAAIGVTVAWRTGWQPGRLYRAAAWCLPMLAVWLLATELASHSLGPVAATPRLAWLAARNGDYLAAAVLLAPGAIAAGLLAAALAWSLRHRSMAARAGGTSPHAAIAFDQRQWRHQVRSAQARVAAPGAVPLLTAGGDFVAGGVIRAIGHPDRDLARLPASRLRSHQIVLGGTGTGKTTLLLRLWAGFMASGLRLHAAGQAGPPLLVVIDCKGGADARRIADRYGRVLRESGARNVAVWPDGASLSLWSLPAGKLITTLVDLIEHGTGAAAYYADVMEAVVALAVEAPVGPPASTADFLTRLDAGWLAQAWLNDGDRGAVARSAARQLPDIALRFRTLFRRLGAGLEGPGSFDDADAWYCILEGTAEVSVAEAQARALVDLLASYVTGAPAKHRQVLLAVDEFSAVSRRLPIWELFERARSLGLTVQVSAQSWHGLAAREDDRYRLAATAEGGIWLLRTPHPDPVTALAGQRPQVDSTRHLIGWLHWSRTGTSRLQQAPVADKELIRRLDVGQAAYLYRGGVTYTQVKRLVAGPAALAAPVPGGSQPAVAQRATAQHSTAQLRPQVRPRTALGRCRWCHRFRRCRHAGSCHVGRSFGLPDRGVRAAEEGAMTSPFDALGLAASAELSDDDVRAAWRRAAAASHPDRADGGDPAAFADAAAAYTLLRTAAGRSEAIADMREAASGGAGHGPVPGPMKLLPAAAARLASRVRRGRPFRLAMRVLAVIAAGSVAVAAVGWQPASAAVIAGALTWLLRTSPADLAGPP